MKKKVFKKRYVLGEGFPWVMGTGRPDSPYNELALLNQPMMNGSFVAFQFPVELWSKNLPKYRVVLEKVE